MLLGTTSSDITNTTNTIIITSTTDITSTFSIMTSIEPTPCNSKLKHIRQIILIVCL